MKLLPPPTAEERAEARVAAAALRALIGNPPLWGAPTSVHIDLARPRRGIWRTTWANLPGFVCVDRFRFSHVLLPGWQYARTEIEVEMIPDLEALADRGERPGQAAGPAQAEPIPALTLWQPWATLVAEEFKPYEFRSYPARKGLWGQRIAIHAGARPVKRAEIDDLLVALRLEQG